MFQNKLWLQCKADIIYVLIISLNVDVKFIDLFEIFVDLFLNTQKCNLRKGMIQYIKGPSFVVGLHCGTAEMPIMAILL